MRSNTTTYHAILFASFDHPLVNYSIFINFFEQKKDACLPDYETLFAFFSSFTLPKQHHSVFPFIFCYKASHMSDMVLIHSVPE